MTVGKKPDAARLDKIVADARRAADQRELGYRERSLKMYPWVCRPGTKPEIGRGRAGNA
ncbi:hypothetical protein [Duganella vulcania]|uniref:hypothetical protein n=1 Tax=Duganella vulcania TaxID=2692166 RepID=UPI0020C3FF36|nr:hypothetical protein [Duganella vulcania]